MQLLKKTNGTILNHAVFVLCAIKNLHRPYSDDTCGWAAPSGPKGKVMKKLSMPDEQTIRTYIKEIGIQSIESDKSKPKYHKYLQDEIAALANEFFLTPEKEYMPPGFRGGNHNGYIDVVGSIGSEPIEAIEIDSLLREKTIRKLLASNANLFMALPHLSLW